MPRQYTRSNAPVPADKQQIYAIIMAAIRRADSTNLARLRAMFPEVVAEVEARYNAPGAILETD